MKEIYQSNPYTRGVYTHRFPTVLHLLVSLILWCSTEHIKISLSLLRNRQNRCHISAPVAIVRRGPHGREVVVEERGVPVHAQLVCAEDARHPVRLEELVDDA